MRSFGYQWHITDRCALRCTHCYQERSDRGAELSASVLCRVADDVLGAIAPRPVTVNVTGGEPLLAPQLVPLLEHLQAAPNVEAVDLITNGIITGDAMERRLSRAGALSCVRHVKVSVESADPSVNDAIRGLGSLAEAVAGIKRIGQLAGKPVVVMATLMRSNAAGIPALVRLAQDVGAAGIILERFVPVGGAAAAREQAIVEGQWPVVTDAIARVAGVEADPGDLARYRAFWLRFQGGGIAVSGAFCNLGESMALMPDGTVFPCRRLPLRVGNVLEEPFAEILPRLETWCGDGACRALERALGSEAPA